MTKKKEGAIMGRPRKEFSAEQFEKLCHIQCTKEEIAAFFGFSEDTLERRVREIYDETFAVVFAEKREGGRESLRRAQWKNAIEGNNPIMQIFLGKIVLGQKDKQDIDMTIDATISMEKALEEMD